jgi:DNA-cytosine methyltransferase
MKYFSTFTGIGGFEIAMPVDWECIGFSEIDKYAIQVYQKHFPKHKNYGNITNINIDSLPDFDLLVGGFPCQDLSIAKKNREGLDGKRSGLFYHLLKILEIKKPRYYLFENVASMNSLARKTITYEISKITGHYIEPVAIDATLVSAQRRKRLFWCNWHIEQPQDRNIFLKDILEKDVDEKYYIVGARLNWLKSQSGAKSIAMGMAHINPEKGGVLKARSDPSWRCNYIASQVGFLGQGGQGNRVYSVNGKSTTLASNAGGRGAKTGLYCVGILPESEKPKGNYLPRERIFSPDGKFRAVSMASNQQPFVLDCYNKTIKDDGKAKTLGSNPQCKTSVAGQGILFLTENQKNEQLTSNIRKLTPIECERLQCFPDGYTEGISDTQRYKCLGNAVNVEVIKHIISFLKEENILMQKQEYLF